MTALDLLTAIISGAKSLAALDGYCKAVWSDWGAGQLTDEQAQSLAETIEARRREVRGSDTVAARIPQVAAKAKSAGRPSHFPPKRRAPRSPEPARVDRAAPNARRVRPHAAPARLPVHDGGARRAAGSSPTPCATEAACMMALGEIAARAGVCVTTARNALRRAAREGLLTIEERRRDKRPQSTPTSCGSCRASGRAGSRAAGGLKSQALRVRRGEGAKKRGPRTKLLSEPHAATA